MSLDSLEDAAAAGEKMTQARRSSLSTRMLLQATADLIAERGYEGTTLIEIGKRAGYSHGLVTRRFGTKAMLVRSLIERLSSQFGHEAGLVETIGDATGIDAIEKVLIGIRRSATTSQDALRGFYALLFESLKPTVGLLDYIRQLHADFLSDVSERVAAGHRTGRLGDDVDASALAELMINAMRGLAYRWMLDPERVDMVKGIDALRVQLRALSGVELDAT
jgi:AcrR family transcriptional regulator